MGVAVDWLHHVVALFHFAGSSPGAQRPGGQDNLVIILEDVLQRADPMPHSSPYCLVMLPSSSSFDDGPLLYTDPLAPDLMLLVPLLVFMAMDHRMLISRPSRDK